MSGVTAAGDEPSPFGRSVGTSTTGVDLGELCDSTSTAADRAVPRRGVAPALAADELAATVVPGFEDRLGVVLVPRGVAWLSELAEGVAASVVSALAHAAEAMPAVPIPTARASAPTVLTYLSAVHGAYPVQREDEDWEPQFRGF